MSLLLLLVLALCPMLVGIFARAVDGSWVSPAAFFAFIWVAVTGPAVLVFTDSPGIEFVVGWVLVSTFAVLVGSMLAREFAPAQARARPSVTYVRSLLPGLAILPVLGALGGVMEIVFLFRRQGASWTALISFAALGQLTASNRMSYIYGDMQQETSEVLIMATLYLACLMGGVLFRLRLHKREAVYGLAPLIMILLVFGLYGSRMGALFGGSFWVAAYMAASVLVGTDEQVRGGKFLVRVGLVAATLGFGLSVGTQVVRYSVHTNGPTWDRILGDGISFVAAAGIWFRDHLFDVDGYLMGGRVFRKLLSPFGISSPDAPAIDVGFTSSNVYTVLKDLVEDFGPLGAIAFLISFGFAGRVLFTQTARGNIWSLAGLALIFAFSLTSVAYSMFYYTTTGAAAIAFVGYFALVRLRKYWHSRSSNPAALPEGSL